MLFIGSSYVTANQQRRRIESIANRQGAYWLTNCFDMHARDNSIGVTRAGQLPGATGRCRVGGGAPTVGRVPLTPAANDLRAFWPSGRG